tara:strand:- start:659 stop:1465 length:807 start_codon:yes stop_codon:yes gene_type:complete
MIKEKMLVKVGGSKGINYDLFLFDFSKFKRTILVHGGSSQLNDISTELKHPPNIIESDKGMTTRYTDRKTMDMFNMIYAGKMNKMIVEKLQKLSVNAVGLSGLDGRLIEGKKNKPYRVMQNGKKRVIRGDLSGKITSVNDRILKLLIENDFTPVLCPPAISSEHEAINVDGDKLASKVASKLRCETLLILSNVPGLLRDPNDSSSLIKKIRFDEIDYHIEKFALGRMKKKLIGAKEAIKSGVKKVIMSTAVNENPITNALNGSGTVIE